MVPAELAIELAQNAIPFSNISPEINYHFILEEDRKKIMDEVQFYKEEKNKPKDMIFGTDELVWTSINIAE